jgi:hypothetical protein
MLEILNSVLDVQISRARKYGFIPFTFDADVKGKKPRTTGQSDRLASHAAELSLDTLGPAPAISAKLRELAALQLGDTRLENLLRDIVVSRGRDSRASNGNTAEAARPPATATDLSRTNTSLTHGREILRLLECYTKYDNELYLKAAEQQARMAYAMFCDGKSPLPKAFSGGLQKTASGQDFHDFYFRGAELMHAFALLGEALNNTPYMDKKGAAQ